MASGSGTANSKRPARNETGDSRSGQAPSRQVDVPTTSAVSKEHSKLFGVKGINFLQTFQALDSVLVEVKSEDTSSVTTDQDMETANDLEPSTNESNEQEDNPYRNMLIMGASIHCLSV